MSRWSFRSNLPGRGRYELPTPHIPVTPPPVDNENDEPAEQPTATPVRAPANRSPRFPQQPPTGEQP